MAATRTSSICTQAFEISCCLCQSRAGGRYRAYRVLGFGMGVICTSSICTRPLEISCCLCQSRAGGRFRVYRILGFGMGVICTSSICTRPLEISCCLCQSRAGGRFRVYRVQGLGIGVTYNPHPHCILLSMLRCQWTRKSAHPQHLEGARQKLWRRERPGPPEH